MTTDLITEASLLALCDEHYVQTRRHVTSLALPVGTLDRLKRIMGAERRFRPSRLVLQTTKGMVALEELEGATRPSVLSDSPVAAPGPQPEPFFVAWDAGWGWTKWWHIERLPEITHTWCGKTIPGPPANVKRDVTASTLEICPECLLIFSRQPA